MQNEILDFIDRRFKKDCDWLTGNCYYFALILKDRFPEGEIYYDVINGHFVFLHQNDVYDWTGLSESEVSYGVLVRWKDFNNYDPLQRERIMQDCIM